MKNDDMVADFFGDKKKDAGGIESKDDNVKEVEESSIEEKIDETIKDDGNSIASSLKNINIILCKRCGRPLSNKYNVRRGYGDTCAWKVKKGV